MSNLIDNPLEKPESKYSVDALIFRNSYPERDPNRLNRVSLGNFEVTKYDGLELEEAVIAFDWSFSYGIWSRAEMSVVFDQETSRYVGYSCDKCSPFQVILNPSVMEEAIKRFEQQNEPPFPDPDAIN